MAKIETGYDRRIRAEREQAQRVKEEIERNNREMVRKQQQLARKIADQAREDARKRGIYEIEPWW